ncbi:MAG: amino acid permease [Cellvibrionaceae bacterium]|nr:amino acid permease [Cellvibrionaceae bacterium]|tara:strand:- start:1415 stop:2656 length:1242 start_codon:yes stop_codon:yes gene_type:complete
MTQASSNTVTESPILARRISLPLLTFYGLGTILGAGIYVLAGKVAAASGLLAPLAFVMAATVAGITGLSYCQLVVNYPKSAGEVCYVDEGFHRAWLSRLVGALVVFTGIVSAATLANGFVGYLNSFVGVSPVLTIFVLMLVMTAVAVWGIAESLWLAAAITLIELSGLFLLIGFNVDVLALFPEHAAQLWLPSSGGQWFAVISGAFLAFYAFIGFEDMVNIVEEVKSPQTTMPRAILWALTLSTLLYVWVAVVAVLAMPLDELSASDAPLKALLQNNHPQVAAWVGVISLFAIVNGVLIQLIMASRVLYGMADQGRAPKVFSRVWSRTRTPVIATLVVGAITLMAALWLPLVTLAKATSFIILVIFTLVNFSLLRLRKQPGFVPLTSVPSWPLLGAVLCLGLLGFQLVDVFSR